MRVATYGGGFDGLEHAVRVRNKASGSNRFIIFMAALCGIRRYTATLLAGVIVPDRYFAGILWLGGRVVMQRPAKPWTPVRFRPQPPFTQVLAVLESVLTP